MDNQIRKANILQKLFWEPLTPKIVRLQVLIVLLFTVFAFPILAISGMLFLKYTDYHGQEIEESAGEIIRLVFVQSFSDFKTLALFGFIAVSLIIGFRLLILSLKQSTYLSR